jgi:bacterioferritin (cytochrome b1)
MIKSHKDVIKEKSIDLHRYYPDKYKKNTYYDVPEEVADLLEKERKEENCSISQYRYYIKYTLDLNDYISRTYLLTNNTPETILNKFEEADEQRIDEDIQNKNVEIIYCILDDLTPIAKKKISRIRFRGQKDC